VALSSLHHVIDLEWMKEAYRLTRSIDGVTAAGYATNLEANLLDLLDRIKSGRYKAPPVRRTYIPKTDGRVGHSASRPSKTSWRSERSSSISATSDQMGLTHPETDGTSFTFLGFTHTWSKSRAGWNVVRQVTAKNRYARALAAVTAWCRDNRHQSIADQHAHLTAMMRGHYAYYGISGNFRRISWYAYQVERIWQKWLSRRDRGSRLHLSRFTALLKRHPLPAARIVHRYTTASKALP
jgi:hypothetical protein